MLQQSYSSPSAMPISLPLKLIAGYQFGTALIGSYGLFWIFQQPAGIIEPLSTKSSSIDLLQHWLQTGHWLALLFIGAVVVAIVINILLGVGLLKKYSFARNATIWWDCTVIAIVSLSVIGYNWLAWANFIILFINISIMRYLAKPEVVQMFRRK